MMVGALPREAGCEDDVGFPPEDDDRGGLPRVTALAEGKPGEARRALMRYSRPRSPA